MGMPREMEDIEKGRAMGRDAGPAHSDIAQGSTVNSSHLELFRTGSPHAVICPQHCHQRLLIRGKLEMHQENGNFSLQVSIQLQNSKIFCADRVLKLHSIFFSTNGSHININTESVYNKPGEYRLYFAFEEIPVHVCLLGPKRLIQLPV